MQFTKPQKIILGVVGFIILFFLLVALNIIPGLRKNGPTASLTVWGVGDASAVWDASIQSYHQAHPNVAITYAQIDQSQYQSKLIDALASGSGPDVFMFNNTWLTKHGDKIIAAPTSLITTSTYGNLFPQIAVQDFTSNGYVDAMPLSVDTLALLYNRDIFNQTGIAVPPTTWKQFETDVRLTRKQSFAVITRPAVALGGTLASMSNATDILNLLFLQTGTEMLIPGAYQAGFSSAAGATALSFYTQFANPSSPYYTWNDSKGPALNAFASGKTAMFIGYASQIADIKAQNPYLNLGVAAVPQFNPGNQVNYPNYWGLAVSKQSQSQAVAWDFINFVTTDQATANTYAASSKRPPALRSLISQYEGDAVLGPYASQALTAEDWIQPNSDTVSTIFSNMIESVLNRSASVGQALQTGESSINSLLIPQR